MVMNYTLLDNGAAASFGTNNLLKKLDVSGLRCQVLVATMNGVEARRESMMACLEVIDHDALVELPMVFSTSQLPVSNEAIPKQKDVDQ